MAQDQSHQHVLNDGYCDYSLITTECVLSHQGTTLLMHFPRLTKIPASQGYIEDEEYAREVTLQVVPVALTTEEIGEASAQDEDLKVVHACLQSGD